MKVFVFAVYSQVIYTRNELRDGLAQQRSVSNLSRLPRSTMCWCSENREEISAVFPMSDLRRMYVHNSHLAVLCSANLLSVSAYDCVLVYFYMSC